MGGMARVSIGLPVYNGERFLEDAIRSVLAQGWDDLELVVSDNASTDRTPEIIRDYAAMDRRVRPFRNPVNLGAAPNYNRTWNNSRGEYFKWLAHDDRLTERFVEQTVAALEAAPDAVLCSSVVEYIDGEGRQLGLYDSEAWRAGGADPAERFAAMVLRSHSCTDFFGMIRRRAMVGSMLHGSFHGADRAFLAQLALRGRLLQVHSPLVQMREHPNRYTRQQTSARARHVWHDTRAPDSRNLPTATLFRAYWRLVDSEALRASKRRQCRRTLLRWWLTNWNLLRLAVDLVAVPFPRAVSVAERAKAAVFGVAPGHFLD
jgi:glycosyltransferase involved in cell wall biosynthesis